MTQTPEKTTERSEEPEETTLAPAVTAETTSNTPETTVEEPSETMNTSDSHEVTEPVTPAKGCPASAGCTAILLKPV